MNQQTRRGQRLALKFAVLQMICAGAVAVVALFVGDFNSFRSASVGGLIIAIGTIVFAWRMFSSSWPAANAARGFYAGEGFKWIWTIGALWLALSYGKFDGLWLLMGLIAAQFGFWIAMQVWK